MADGIKRFADDIEYIHLKNVSPDADLTDALTSGSFHLRNIILYYSAMTDLGEGIIDFKSVADIFSVIEYTGDVAVEVEIQRADTLIHAKQNINHW